MQGDSHVLQTIDLTDRQARCPYCKKLAPSDEALPFFMYCGPGSDNCDHCAYTERAHEPEVRGRPHLAKTKLADGHAYSNAIGREFDSFYCGCRGWD